MRLRKYVGLSFAAVVLLVFCLHEALHIHRFGHLCPLALHIDVSVTSSAELLGVTGPANIYKARLTNFGLLPRTIVACEYINWASQRAIMLDYIVERRKDRADKWRFVQKWDESRLFCRPAFEVTATHIVRKWLWPGQSLYVGSGVPAQWGGFQAGDAGRFTLFKNGDSDGARVLSSPQFVADRSPRPGLVPDPR